MRKKWTEKDDQIMRSLYRELGAAPLAKRFGVTKDAIWLRAGVLGLSSNTSHRWTPEEVALIGKRYLTDGPDKLAL